MTKQIDQDRIETLILSRIQSSKKPTRGSLRKDLTPFVSDVLTPGEWTALLDRCLASLIDSRAIEAKPLRATPRGEELLLERLGGTRIPPWKTVIQQIVPSIGLGLPLDSEKIRKRLRAGDGLRASILREKLELPIAEAPTLAQAVDALVWRELGVESDAPLTLKRVRKHLLEKRIGRSTRLTAEALPRLIAADAIGSLNMDPNTLRQQLVRNWLAGPRSDSERSLDTEGSADTTSPAPPEPPHDQVSTSVALPLSELAAMVQEAADGSTTGRFGERKVFISATWRALQGDPRLSGMDLSTFKRLLVEANHHGLLALHRADLVGAMNPTEVAASETRHLNAVFHFIESKQRS